MAGFTLDQINEQLAGEVETPIPDPGGFSLDEINRQLAGEPEEKPEVPAPSVALETDPFGGTEVPTGPEIDQGTTAVPGEIGRLQSGAASVALGGVDVLSGIPKSIALIKNQEAQRELTIYDAIRTGKIKTQADLFNMEIQRRLPGQSSSPQSATGNQIRFLQGTKEEREKLTAEATKIFFGVKEDPLFRFGLALDEAAASAFAVNPKFAEEFFAGKVARGMGSMLAFFGITAVGRRLGLPGATGAALSGAALGMVESFEDALRSGASIEDAYAAGNWGALVGLSEALPIASLLSRLDKATSGIIKRAIINAMIESTEEAAQEAFQSIMKNLIASDIVQYDPDRKMWIGVGEGAGVGATVGGLMGFVMTLAFGRRGRTRGQGDQPTGADRLQEILDDDRPVEELREEARQQDEVEDEREAQRLTRLDENLQTVRQDITGLPRTGTEVVVTQRDGRQFLARMGDIGEVDEQSENYEFQVVNAEGETLSFFNDEARVDEPRPSQPVVAPTDEPPAPPPGAPGLVAEPEPITPPVGPAAPTAEGVAPLAGPAPAVPVPEVADPAEVGFEDFTRAAETFVRGKNGGKVTPRMLMLNLANLNEAQAKKLIERMRVNGVLTNNSRARKNQTKPQTVIDIIREMGGIVNSAELEGLNLRTTRPGLVNNKTGRSLNDIRVRLEELNILPQFGQDEQNTNSDFDVVNFISEELAGNPTINPADQTLQDDLDAQAAEDDNERQKEEAIDRAFVEAGITDATAEEMIQAQEFMNDPAIDPASAVNAVVQMFASNLTENIVDADPSLEDIPFDVVTDTQPEQGRGSEVVPQAIAEPEVVPTPAETSQADQPAAPGPSQERSQAAAADLLAIPAFLDRREKVPAAPTEAAAPEEVPAVPEKVEAAPTPAQEPTPAAPPAPQIAAPAAGPTTPPPKTEPNKSLVDAFKHGLETGDVAQDPNIASSTTSDAFVLGVHFNKTGEEVLVEKTGDIRQGKGRSIRIGKRRFIVDDDQGVTEVVEGGPQTLEEVRKAKTKLAVDDKPTTETVETVDGPREQFIIPDAQKIKDRELIERRRDERKKLPEGVAAQGVEGLPLFGSEQAATKEVKKKDQGTLFAVSREFNDRLPAIFETLRAELDRLGLKNVVLDLKSGKIEQAALAQVPEGLFIRGSFNMDNLVGRIFVNPNLAGEGRRRETLRHEVIHALRGMGYISPTEWAVLEEKAGDEWIEKHDIEARYPTLTGQQQLEEAVADEFSQWIAGRNAPKGRIKRIFARLRKMLEALGSAIGQNGLLTPDTVFGRIESGEVGRRVPRGAAVVAAERMAGATQLQVEDDERQPRLGAKPISKLPDSAQRDRMPGIPGMGTDQGTFAMNFAFESRSVLDFLADHNLRLLDRIKLASRSAFRGGRFLFQDKFIDQKLIQREIAKARGRQIEEGVDAYMAEELYHGRVGKQLDDFKQQRVEPLVEAISAAGISRDELELWLYARHAKERNDKIAEINPELPDGGSGMTNAEAQEILDAVTAEMKPVMEALGKRVDQITNETRDILVAGGLIDDRTRLKWEQDAPHYVPLKGFETGDELVDLSTPSQNTGRGFDIRGPESKRALGRESRAANILANVLSKFEESVIRAEKNRAGRTFLRLVEQNPDPELWEIDVRDYVRRIDPRTGLVGWKPDPLYNRNQNVLAVKVGGKVHYITIKHAGLARAWKNLGSEKMNSVLRTFATMNRYLAFINTSLNPEFVVSNFFRDLQTAGINLQQFEYDNLLVKVGKDVPRAVQGAFGGIRGKKDTEWQKHFHEFADAGGKIAFFGLDDIELRQRKIDRLMKEVDPSNPRKLLIALRKAKDLVGDVNGAVENGVRLSTFVQLRREGVSKDKAASIARNLTVNFNKKGELGPVFGSLFLFYNASIQGTTILFRAAKSKRVRKIMGGIVLFTVGVDLLNAFVSPLVDDDDDRKLYDDISKWNKDHNFYIMNPWVDPEVIKNNPEAAIAIKFPLPYGYNIFHVTGRVIGEVIRGVTTPMEGAINIVVAAADAFNPMGAAPTITQFLTPTVLKPFAQIGENLDFAGRPIRKDPNPFATVPTPDSQNFFSTVSKTSRIFTQQLNAITGGNEFRSGGIDISPETLDLFYDFLTGGAGMFVERSGDFMLKKATGKPVEWRDVPFLRRLIEGKNKWADSQRYREIREGAFTAEKEQDGFKEAGRKADAEAAKTKFPVDNKMIKHIKAIDKRLRKLRKERNRLRAIEDDEKRKRKVDKVEAKMQLLHKKAIRKYNRLKKGTSTVVPEPQSAQPSPGEAQ